MRHPSDGMLRRLADEPLAVPDRVSEHAAACGRCSARQARIRDDADFAARLLSAPQLVPDSDAAWQRFQRELTDPAPASAPRVRVPAHGSRRRNPFPRLSLRAGLAIGATAVVLAGTAAAATLTTIFEPTHVAPLSFSRADMRAISAFTGLDGSRVLGGFAKPTGSTTTRFGTVDWSSAGRAHPASSLAQASAEAGFPASLPARLPAGVGAVRQFVVQPRVSATVTFNSTAAGVAGSSVTLDAGPAILAVYGGTSAAGVAAEVPTLAVAAMPRPTAASSGASMSQIEAFLLAQPGVPAQLAEEIRLLGDLQTTLPVPVPRGAAARSVQIAGSPGLLLTDSSNAVSGVVWEDGQGMIHFVAGILDSQDVLNVADQLG